MIENDTLSNLNIRVQRLMTLGKETSLANPHLVLENRNDQKGSEEKDEIYEKANMFFQQNLFTSFVCMLTGLYCIMFIPSIVKVLHGTGKSDDRKKAFKR